MLNPKLIRENLPSVAKAVALKGVTLAVDKIAALESRRKILQVDTQFF